MRNGKFRIWHKELRRMFYSHEIDELVGEPSGCHGASLVLLPEGELCIVNWELGCLFYADVFERMDCTGLKDKNDKETYEGDRVRCKYHKDVWVQQVEYDDRYAGFQPFCEPVDYDEVYLSDYEVIGNIYENPELAVENDST